MENDLVTCHVRLLLNRESHTAMQLDKGGIKYVCVKRMCVCVCVY